MNWTKYINFSAVADGLVGGVLPTMVLYFPVLPGNPYHELEGKRYWTMMASRARSVAGGIATSSFDLLIFWGVLPSHPRFPSGRDLPSLRALL